jgi:hypothetical protein
MARPRKNPEVPQGVNQDDSEAFVPEVVDEGVIRSEAKENPLDLVADIERKRKKGKWRKVTREELVQAEAQGLLIGYDQETEEALIKEK